MRGGVKIWGREIDCPFRPFDLFQELRQCFHGEDSLRQLGEKRQITRLQTAAVEDVESVFL